MAQRKSITGRGGVSKSYLTHDTIGRVDRKSWNKAIDLIQNIKAKRTNSTVSFCVKDIENSRTNTAGLFGTECNHRPLMSELRRAILRHDWKTVHQLHLCLLQEYHFRTRLLCNKVMMASLLSSTTSDSQIYEDFCRMGLGLDDAEMEVFTKTIKRLPEEIPRGFVANLKGKMLLMSNQARSDRVTLGVSAAYMKASLPVRKEVEGPASASSPDDDDSD